MCKQSFSQGGFHHEAECCTCGCSPCRCGGGFQRRFRTVEEEAEELEEYIKELEKELEGAKRALKELTD